MSETCRVIINQVKQKLHLVGYLPIQYYKDARYHEHKMYMYLGHVQQNSSSSHACMSPLHSVSILNSY